MLTFQLSCSVQTPFPSMPQTLMLKPVRREDEVQANNVLLVDTARGKSLAIEIIGRVSHQIIVGGVYRVFLVHGQRVRSTGSKARRRAPVGDVSRKCASLLLLHVSLWSDGLLLQYITSS
jgi:hypothetical protein